MLGTSAWRPGNIMAAEKLRLQLELSLVPSHERKLDLEDRFPSWNFSIMLLFNDFFLNFVFTSVTVLAHWASLYQLEILSPSAGWNTEKTLWLRSQDIYSCFQAHIDITSLKKFHDM